jgi:hypothetical protein
MNSRTAKLILTTDQFGQLMPSYLFTAISNEARQLGLVEDCIGKDTDFAWEKLTEKGQVAKRRLQAFQCPDCGTELETAGSIITAMQNASVDGRIDPFSEARIRDEFSLISARCPKCRYIQ